MLHDEIIHYSEFFPVILLVVSKGFNQATVNNEAVRKGFNQVTVNSEAVRLPERCNSFLPELHAIIHAAPTQDSTQPEDIGRQTPTLSNSG